MTTPGPWAVLPLKTKTLIVSAHNLHVAELEGASPEDAALMASAPALLAALQGLIGSLAKLKSGDYVVGRDSIWLDVARAAIDNATGGQP